MTERIRAGLDEPTLRLTWRSLSDTHFVTEYGHLHLAVFRGVRSFADVIAWAVYRDSARLRHGSLRSLRDLDAFEAAELAAFQEHERIVSEGLCPRKGR